MAFKMKRKGFPMKGESPNKIRDYSSAMDMKKEESPAKAYGDYRYDVDEMTGKEKVVRVPTGDRSIGTGGFQTGPDIDKTMSESEKKRYIKNLKNIGIKRGRHGYKEGQLTEMADAFELSDEFPGNPAARRAKTGMSREEEARRIDEEIQRKVNAKEPLTEKEARYNKMIQDYYTRKMSADSPAEMKSGFKMKSPLEAPNVNVYRDGQEYLYGDADDPNSVIDETKKAMEFEEKNKNIISRNLDENREEITDLEYKIQDAEDSGNTELANQLTKQKDSIMNEGIFNIDYSGKHAIQRNMADDTGMMEGREGSQYVEGGDLATGASYIGEEPDSFRRGGKMGEDEYGNPIPVGGKRIKFYGDPFDPKKQGTQEFIDTREESDDLLDEQRRQRKEAADSPAGMKKESSPNKYGRSKTVGPVIRDTRISYKEPGTSKSIGPQESPKAIAEKEMLARQETKGPSGTVFDASDADLERDAKERRDYQDARSFVKMKKQKSPIEMKKGFKMKGNPYKMGKMQTASAVKMAKEAMAKMKKEESAMDMKKPSAMDMKNKESAMEMKKAPSPTKAAKPDYPDIDGDGNTTESMKQAAADKKAGPNKLKKPARKMYTPEEPPKPAELKEKPIKMKKEDSPSKLKKPTRKMDTAEEAPKMKAKGKAVAKMKKEDSPNKKYKSAAQRKAVHASKADGGKGNPNKMKKKND